MNLVSQSTLTDESLLSVQQVEALQREITAAVIRNTAIAGNFNLFSTKSDAGYTNII
jgi:hypothetical protein